TDAHHGRRRCGAAAAAELLQRSRLQVAGRARGSRVPARAPGEGRRAAVRRGGLDAPFLVDPGGARADPTAVALQRKHASARPALLSTPLVSDALRPMIAFVGPSISRAEAERVCPGLDLRPPIRRNDLYHERELGAWGFLIIDGVFMH